MILSLGTMISCSGKQRREKSTSEIKEEDAKPGKSWDYDRIREAREAENVQTPTQGDLTKLQEEDAKCLVMSRSEMIRSKASGCRPVDPRAGLGEDRFCCPK